ncbi:LacI family DNA-binding transcriptional regulator [Enterococcus sp. LJL99]
MKKVSMQDIADKLAISKNSVSQALRDTDGVSETTKKAVIQTAQELGYSYKSKTTAKENGKILLVATDFALSQISFFGEIIESIRKQAMKLDYSFETQTITKKMINEQKLPESIEAYTGLIVLSHSDNAYIKKLLDLNLPTVLVDHHDPSLLVDTILSKNTDGTYLAISLLNQNNHKRIGFIGDIHFSPSYLERYRGYQRALTDLGLPTEDDIEITAIEESQGALFERLKQVKEMPDAWFCVNSGLAFMLNTYLQSNGYIIPDDCSIICFDDTEFTRMAQPAITNVATDLNYMGELAMETLVERIADQLHPFVHKQIVPSLNIYDSVKKM